MNWVIAAAAGWAVAALLLGILIGKGIKLADAKRPKPEAYTIKVNGGFPPGMPTSGPLNSPSGQAKVQ